MQDAANVLGNFFKLLVAVVIFGFSTVLEYTFFLSISPADKPWFPILAMGLTAGGFIGWLLSFRLIRHNPLHTMIAFLMMIGCALASLVVAGTEFYSWIAEHYDIATNPAMYQQVTTMLLVVFCAHVVALLVDVSCAHFARNPFRGNGVLLPQNYPQSGNLIPMYPQYPYYQNALPQYAEGRGEPAAPFVSKQRKPAPKVEPAGFDNSAEIETPPVQTPKKPLPPTTQEPAFGLGDMLREGVSLLTAKGKNFTSNIKTGGHAPGNQNATTSENT
jgi:hypothetical protein